MKNSNDELERVKILLNPLEDASKNCSTFDNNIETAQNQQEDEKEDANMSNEGEETNEHDPRNNFERQAVGFSFNEKLVSDHIIVYDKLEFDQHISSGYNSPNQMSQLISECEFVIEQ